MAKESNREREVTRNVNKNSIRQSLFPRSNDVALIFPEVMVSQTNTDVPNALLHAVEDDPFSLPRLPQEKMCNSNQIC